MSNGILRGGIAAVAGQRARWNLAEMAVEALMVVFAVLVAFGVEEWRTERQLRQFAGVARAAVELEMQENLDGFRTTAASLRGLSERLAQVVRADSEDDPVFEERRLDLSLGLPEMTSAAWRTAQASEAAPYFDYDWVIQVSQAYDILAAYERIQHQMLDSLSLALANLSAGMHPLEVREELIQAYGRVLLAGAHEEVQRQMEELLADEEAASAPE